jgi:hypothetical protein
MFLYLQDGSYMFRQNNAILREQLGSFLSYFNVSTVGGKSWDIWYRQGRPLDGASGALVPGADFEGGAKKAVTDRPHVNT